MENRRKEELEKKRQKLAELRRAREERRAVLENQSNQSQSSSVITVYFIQLRALLRVYDGQATHLDKSRRQAKTGRRLMTSLRLSSGSVLARRVLRGLAQTAAQTPARNSPHHARLLQTLATLYPEHLSASKSNVQK